MTGGHEGRRPDADGDRVEIRLLGPLQVRRADGTVVEPREWRTGKTADLVRLLALRAGEPVPVDVLLDTLWPSVDEQRGRASLRTAASQVRRVLGQDCLGRRLGGLVMHDVWVDAVVFRSLAAEARRSFRSGQLARALAVTREAEALYLDDLRAHDDGAEWAGRERQALLTAYRELLADAADAAVELGWMRDAVDFATRSLALDPCSERAYRALIQAHAGLGEIEHALREYERCRAVLAEELGADPSAQTRALHLQLLSPEPAEPVTPPFVGRDSELRWLRTRVRAALDRREPAVVCLVGEPGVGKSRLVAEAYRRVEGRVVRISCRAAGEPVDRPRSPVARLVSGVAAVGDAEDDLAALERALRQGKPVVVVVEDLHEAQPQRLARLGRLVAELDGALALVVTARPTSRGPDVDEDAVGHLLTAVGPALGRVHRLALSPLGGDDVASLAGELLAGSVAPQLVTTLLEETGGVPGRVVTTVRRWLREGRIAVTVGGLVLMPPRDGSGTDPAVRPLLSRLVRQLSAAELDILHLVAVLDRRVSPATVVPLLGEDHGVHDTAAARQRVQATLDHLVDLSVLVTDPAGYSCRHPLLRDAVLSWLRPSTRRRLHHRVAERALIAPAERIDHWLAAGEPQLACAAALEASTEAMADGRYDEARSHLIRVCALGDLPEASPVDRVSLFERLGDACARLGRREEARAAYAVATSVSHRYGLGDLSRVRAKGEAVAADDWLETLSSAVVPGQAGRRTGLAERLGVGPATLPRPEVEQRLRAALDEADTSGDPVARAEAGVLLARVVHTPRRQLAQSLLAAHQALAITADPLARARAMLEACRHAALLGDARLVEHHLERALDLAVAARDLETRLDVEVLRTLVAHDLGRAEFTGRWEAAEGLAGVTAAGYDSSWLAVRVLTERGELALAQAYDRRPLPAATRPQDVHLRRLASAALHAELGDRAGAIEELRGLVDTLAASGCTLLLPEAAARLVMLEAVVDPGAAREHFELFDWAVGGESGLPREGFLRLLARTAIRCAEGQYDRAAAAAANAAGMTESRGLPFLAARAHLARSHNLGLAGRAGEARLAVTAAAQCYRAAGATELARRVEAARPPIGQPVPTRPVLAEPQSAPTVVNLR